MSLPPHIAPIDDPLGPLPQPHVAALAIRAVSVLLIDVSEPYRLSAYALGWEEMDGSDWWHEVMDLVG